jgi:hypothetical protein
MTFVNISNHPSANWSQDQKNAVYSQFGTGRIVDVPFPNVDPLDSTEEIEKIALALVAVVLTEHNPRYVMVQGEFTLTFTMTVLFQKAGLDVVVATSERKVEETVLPDGSTQKKAIFNFVQFRKQPFYFHQKEGSPDRDVTYIDDGFSDY